MKIFGHVKHVTYQLLVAVAGALFEIVLFSNPVYPRLKHLLCPHTTIFLSFIVREEVVAKRFERKKTEYS